MDAPAHLISLRRPAVGSRRKALAIGLLFALAWLPTSSSAVEPSTDHDVVIVGAGAAGLYAARTLDDLGYSVLVLEATPWHGGRVWSMNLGDVRIENGAEELYGPTNNFVFNDIKSAYTPQAQIKIFENTAAQDTLIVMDADGLGGGTPCWVETGNCDLDPDIVDYWDFYDDIGNHDNDATEPEQLVSDYLDTSWGVPSTSPGYHLYDVANPGGEYGTTVERLGLRSLSREWNSWSLSGTLYGLEPTGYADALDFLYFDPILPYVTYNSPVTVVDTSGIKPVAIDANGVYHYADAIIVTVSVGVLQAEIIDFIPDLPAPKVTAYNTIGMGNGMKISLRFTSQLWDNKLMSVFLDGPTGWCWPPKVYQPSVMDHVLTCFTMGTNSEVMEALPDDAARLNQALVDLDAAFGVGTATAPGAFIEGFVMNWTGSPYTLGSYSYPAPGTRPIAGLTMREVLAQPVGTNLYFAGEATHNTAASTVPGALQSGERAAGEAAADIGPLVPGTPTADFSASVTVGNAPLDVSFTDLSSQVPTGWSWDFGDTGSSGVQHAAHQYTTPGTYTVSLTATNANGSHTRVLPNLIEVPEPSGMVMLGSGLIGVMLLHARRRSIRR